MDHYRCYFTKRDQNKSPVLDQRMRDIKFRSAYHNIPVQQDINVDGPGNILTVVPDPSKLVLDEPYFLNQICRFKNCVYTYNHIEEIIIALKSPWFSLINT